MSGLITDPKTISRRMELEFPVPADMPAALADALYRIERARRERVKVRRRAQADDHGDAPLVGILESAGADPDTGQSWLVVALDRGGRYAGEASDWEII